MDTIQTHQEQKAMEVRIKKELRGFLSERRKSFTKQGKLAPELLDALENLIEQNGQAGFCVVEEYESITKSQATVPVVRVGAAFEMLSTYIALQHLLVVRGKELDRVFEGLNKLLKDRVRPFRQQKVSEDMIIVLADIALSLAHHMLNDVDLASDVIVKLSTTFGRVSAAVHEASYMSFA